MTKSTTQKNYARGVLGEKLARQFLEKHGYLHIVSNFRVPGGEIDLIVKKNGIIVFVEVKTRTTHAFGEGREALTRLKKQKLLKTIYAFFQKKQLSVSALWRLDLIEITIHQLQKKAEIRHYLNILDEE